MKTKDFSSPIKFLWAGPTLIILWCLAGATSTWGSGVQIQNVKDFGATGSGTIEDSAAVQAAVNAAKNGGTIYYPCGTYLQSATVNVSSSYLYNLRGENSGCVNILVNSAVGFSFTGVGNNAQFTHGGGISNVTLTCQSPSDTAVKTTDLGGDGLMLSDILVTGCSQGFDFVNASGWTERTTAIRVTGWNTTHLFHFDQQSGDPNNSYAYSRFFAIRTVSNSGQDVFYATNGANVLHSIFDAQGNLDGTSGNPAYVFNTTGASQFTGEFHVYVEGVNYYVVNSTGGGSGVYGIGSIRLSNPLGVYTPGSVFYLTQSSQIPQIVGSFTTSAVTSQSISVPVTAFGVCYVTPSNATAASMTGVYVSGVTWQQVTVTHPATVGGSFNIWCSEPF